MRPVKTGTTRPYLPSQLLPEWILTFVFVSLNNIYLKGQDATNKMSWYTFGCSMILHLSDVTALNEAWKRGYWDQSMRAPLGTGRRAEQHKQDDRRRGGPGGELIRDIMSYSEQGKVALYCEPIVHWEGSITYNTWHDDTIPVWEAGLSVYFTQSWPGVITELSDDNHPDHFSDSESWGETRTERRWDTGVWCQGTARGGRLVLTFTPHMHIILQLSSFNAKENFMN